MNSAPRHKLTEAQFAASADQDTGGDRERDEARQIAAKLHHLSSTEVFAPLSPEERRWLAESVTMVTCEAGRVFYTPEDLGEVAFVLKRGRVDLYRLTDDGRKLVVATLDPHTIFGEMALVGQHMYGCYAESTEDCLICVLSREDLQRLVQRNPDVALHLLQSGTCTSCLRNEGFSDSRGWFFRTGYQWKNRFFQGESAYRFKP